MNTRWRKLFQPTGTCANFLEPPSSSEVTLKFPKGVIGYAVCDLLRVILTQSADQMSTGTCSYVASLAALASTFAAERKEDWSKV